MDKLLDLHGDVALVTGAGQGIGRQIAIHLAEHGASGVAVNDYFPDRAEAVASEIEAVGLRAIPAPFDVTNYEQVQAGVALAADALGPIAILVNNAGNSGPDWDGSNAPSFWRTDPGDWDPWLRVNLYGVLNCTRHVLPSMIHRERGRIVTVISDAGRVGEPNLVVYSAAKAGAAGFMRAVAKETGRSGITANCVALAGMRTPQIEAAFADPDLRKRALSNYTIRRFGEPSDAANMVLFLASNAASWITGQTYPVNGGYSVTL